MFAKLYRLLVFHLAIISIDINCQEKQRELEEWVKISNDMMYNIVIATDKGKQITKGLLFGMKGDSIYLSLNKKMISLNLKNLLSLSIEDRRKSNFAAVSGVFSGMYIGSLIFLTSKNQSSKYLDYDGTLGIALYELLFVTAGGGIGYLIDRGSGDRQEVFYFTQNEEGVENEIIRLKNFLSNSSTSKKIKVNFHLSHVNTRLSEIQNKSNDNYYWNGYYNSNYYEIHNFNMLRKLTLTYEVFEKLEIGIALNWFGEPTFYYYKSDFIYDSIYTSINSTISQSYDGLGYYFVINYKPLRNVIPEYFDLLIGAGAGFGEINYNFKNETVTQIPESEPIVATDEKIIDKVFFSSIIMCEIKYYIYPALNLSLQADYIYLPDKMPAIPAFGLNERNLGIFSFGLGLGINF